MLVIQSYEVSVNGTLLEGLLQSMNTTSESIKKELVVTKLRPTLKKG